MISWLVVGGKLKLVVHYTKYKYSRCLWWRGRSAIQVKSLSIGVISTNMFSSSSGGFAQPQPGRHYFGTHPTTLQCPYCNAQVIKSSLSVLCSTTGAGDNCCGELMWRRWLGGGCCLSFWRVTHFLWVRIGVKKLFPSFSMFSTSSMLGAGAAVSFLVSTPWRYLYSRSKI